MGNCDSCGGCDNCGGCANALTLTQDEIDMLLTFGQIPFLPVARKADSETPVYLEETGKDYALILTCMEKKGLIALDYHLPLSGFDYSAYHNCQLHGSMALTARGQSVLDLLSLQGIDQ